MSDNKATVAPNDDAAEWYSSLRDSNIRQVDASLNELQNAHGNLEQQWNALDEKENEGHDSLDTRLLQSVWNERQRIQQEAQQISNGYAALQAERQRLETSPDPTFNELLSNSSQPAQMFLRSHRHRLEGDADTLKRLMHADARAKAVGIKPDSRDYFSILETAVGLDASDRNLDDFKGEFDDSTNTYTAERNEAKRSGTRSKPEIKATEAQKAMAHALPGVTPEEYLAQVANPFSQAAQTVSLEPDELNFGNSSKGLEVSLDEKPKAAPVKYKAPNPATSVNLSPAELSLIENMAVQTNTPLAEARKAFAQQKLALHSGKAGHYMLYDAKLRAEGNR